MKRRSFITVLCSFSVAILLPKHKPASKEIVGYKMIDPEVLARELDLPNWGKLEGDTIQEKVINFQKQGKKLGFTI